MFKRLLVLLISFGYLAAAEELDRCILIRGNEVCERLQPQSCEELVSGTKRHYGAYFLEEDPGEEIALYLKDRLKQVAEIENSLRRKEGLPRISEDAKVTFKRAEYQGPSVSGNATPWIKRGGPQYLAGSDFVLLEPQVARNNSDLVVYFFAKDKIVKTLPFREFAIQKMQGGIIKMKRMLPNYLGREDYAEGAAWQNRNVEELVKVMHTSDRRRSMEAYSRLREYGIHFSVDGFWTGGETAHGDPVVEIDIPKEALLQLAVEKKIEVGSLGGNVKPLEIIVLESGWPVLMNYVSSFIPAQKTK